MYNAFANLNLNGLLLRPALIVPVKDRGLSPIKLLRSTKEKEFRGINVVVLHRPIIKNDFKTIERE